MDTVFRSLGVPSLLKHSTLHREHCICKMVSVILDMSHIHAHGSTLELQIGRWDSLDLEACKGGLLLLPYVCAKCVPLTLPACGSCDINSYFFPHLMWTTPPFYGTGGPATPWSPFVQGTPSHPSLCSCPRSTSQCISSPLGPLQSFSYNGQKSIRLG